MSIRRIIKFGCSLAAMVIGVSGCAYHSHEPIAESKAPARSVRTVPEYYTVVRGDTLYSIAWRYGLDFRGLAERNRLVRPYRILAGSRLRLLSRAPGETDDSPVKPPTRGDRNEPSSVSRPAASAPGSTVSTGHGTQRLASRVDWHWPVRGQVAAPAPDSEKFGVEIFGTDGTPVRAAAPGEVVYSGDRLIGYGKLIIIRHNDVYLSAYGYNSRLLVQEGRRVAAGQEIAEMGHSGTDQAKLYFEIRRNGKPVPPLDYLP